MVSGQAIQLGAHVLFELVIVIHLFISVAVEGYQPVPYIRRADDTSVLPVLAAGDPVRAFVSWDVELDLNPLLFFSYKGCGQFASLAGLVAMS
jgi:hypothetical protein